MLDVKISGFYDEVSRDLDVQIATIKEYGEAYLCPRHLDGKRITGYSAEDFKTQVKPRLDAAGIKFSSIGSPIGKVGIKDEQGFQNQLKQLANLVEICKIMDCKYIRIFSFNFHSDQKLEDYRDVVMTKLRKYVEVVEGTGITLLHENEKGIYGYSAENCVDIMKTINHPQLRLIHDASNFVQEKQDPLAAYHLMKDYVDYYHIKDCDWETGTETPVGYGDGKYAEIFADLSARNYSGFMTMEPHTFKYSMIRKPVVLIPFARYIFKNYYKGYRKLDKKLGKKLFDKVTAKDVFDMQYYGLKKLLEETK